MSLKHFHIVFITISTLLALFCGGWALKFYQENESVGYMALAIGSFSFAVALVVYGVIFFKKMKNEIFGDKVRFITGILPFSIISLLSMNSEAAACSVCYGAKDSALTTGLNYAIIALMFVVFCVLAVLAKFFYSFSRRARKMSMPSVN